MDEDLKDRSRDDLIAMVIDLRNGIRRHRDCAGHDLCWYHPELWQLVEPQTIPSNVPPFPEFIEHCVRYRMSLEQK